MPDIRAYVANFLGCGSGLTQYQDGWVRDSLLFECDGFRFQFIQNQEIATRNSGKFKGRFVSSTEVMIRDVRNKDVSKAINALHRICWLLSFASLSRVICYGYEYPYGTGLERLWAASGAADYFRPIINIRNGEETVRFINKTYNNYKGLERDRKLNVVIDYLLHAEKPDQPTEVRLILAFIVLENLKHTYAKNMSLPYKRGCFWKGTAKRSKPYPFQELVDLMFRQVKMRKGLTRVKNLRNEMIHTGLTNRSHAWQWKKYEQVHDLLREYLLRLLGFSGDYHTYAATGREIRKL